MFFMNPFHRARIEDFEGVYRPLEQSRRKSSIVSGGAPKKSLDDKEMEDGDVAEPQYAPNTLESLKAEIDADIAASGHDSVYDRTFRHDHGVVPGRRQPCREPFFPRGEEVISDPGSRQIQSHQQGHYRHRHGSLPVAAVRSVRVWLVGRQVRAAAPCLSSVLATPCIATNVSQPLASGAQRPPGTTDGADLCRAWR